MATLVDSDSFVFTDGNAGHVCDLGSSPSAGQWDVLCINSNTVVSTPSGWTAAESAVTNQGAYVFARQAAGGEGSTVTVTTSGNHNTFVGWSRWNGIEAVDTSTSTQQNGSAGTNTPTHNTGALAEAGELVIAFGALHSIGTANQTSPAWSSGYTELLNNVQGSGATGVRGLVGYKDNAGTAAETPQVSWSGDGVQNAYMLAISFTVDQGVTGTLAATLPSLAADAAGSYTIPAALGATLPALTVALAQTSNTKGSVAGTVSGSRAAPTVTSTTPAGGVT